MPHTNESKAPEMFIQVYDKIINYMGKNGIGDSISLLKIGGTVVVQGICSIIN